MNTEKAVVNVVFAGLGGQGVLKASDILAEAVFLAGHDVKKAEVHGMSQRGGSVTSEVRFGRKVQSPMTPHGEAGFLVVLVADQAAIHDGVLSEGGRMLLPDMLKDVELPHARSLNVAMLGILSRHLDIEHKMWVAAIRSNFKAELHDVNIQAFELGRALDVA